jgi:Immunoglobulin-like domain of bacterial spore germination
MDPQPDPNHRPWLIAAGVAAVVAAVVIVALVLADDDDSVATDETTTTASTSTSTSTTVATTSTEEPDFAVVDPSVTVFPDPTTSRRFDDPVPLVQAFATEMVGFADPVVGDLLPGDSRSGEVEVRARPDGPVTVVAVRRLEDDTWFVLGATTDAIRLAEPAAGDEVASPLTTSGQAYAFEGTVDVRLLADGTEAPIATGFVTGRGDGVLGDWTGDPIPFEVPEGAEYGVLVLSSEGGEDAAVLDATVVRVAL